MRDQDTDLVPKQSLRVIVVDKVMAFFGGVAKAYRTLRCKVTGCVWGDYLATSNDAGVRQCLDCLKLESISAEEAYLQAALKRRGLG